MIGALRQFKEYRDREVENYVNRRLRNNRRSRQISLIRSTMYRLRHGERVKLPYGAVVRWFERKGFIISISCVAYGHTWCTIMPAVKNKGLIYGYNQSLRTNCDKLYHA